MAGAAGGLLAARVSAAGGYGFIGAAGAESSFLSTEISIVRKELDIPTTSSERLPIGVGFQVWKLHEMDRKEAEKNLRSTAEQVSCVWLSFGHGIESWLAHIDPPCKTAVVVSSVAEAIEASSWTKRPDILVVQGFEAGGHKKADCLPFISLVPEVISALSSHRPLPIILAAGGIATGSQVASALALGADGVVCGTRFLATDEAGYSQKQKDRILQSSGEEAVSTMVFDEMRFVLLFCSVLRRKLNHFCVMQRYHWLACWRRCPWVDKFDAQRLSGRCTSRGAQTSLRRGDEDGRRRPDRHLERDLGRSGEEADGTW